MLPEIANHFRGSLLVVFIEKYNRPIVSAKSTESLYRHLENSLLPA